MTQKSDTLMILFSAFKHVFFLEYLMFSDWRFFLLFKQRSECERIFTFNCCAHGVSSSCDQKVIAFGIPEHYQALMHIQKITTFLVFVMKTCSLCSEDDEAQWPLKTIINIGGINKALRCKAKVSFLSILFSVCFFSSGNKYMDLYICIYIYKAKN